MDSNPIHHPSTAKNNEILIFCITLNIWWLARQVNGLKPHPPPLFSQKSEMLHFCITFNIWCWPDWSMDLNLIHHSSPAKNMKWSFLGYIQLLMISRAVRWTQTPSATPLQPIKWNAHFWIIFSFNFWWSSGVINGLWTPSTTCLQAKKLNASFWIMFTSDDQPGWLMDSNPICNLSPDKKMKWSYFDYVHLLMIGQAGKLTQSPSASPLQPIKWNASFWIMFTSNDQPGCLMNSNPICHPSPGNKMKCFIFGLRWTSDDQPGLVNGLKPHLPASLQPKKWNAHFLDYAQLLMIGWAGRWTQTPSITPLQPIKWNAHFWLTFNFWWSAGLVNGLKPHLPALSSQKNEMLLFGLRSTSNDRLGWSMDSNPILHPSPAKKMKCSLLSYVQLLMIGRAGWGTRTPCTTPLHPKK